MTSATSELHEASTLDYSEAPGGVVVNLTNKRLDLWGEGNGVLVIPPLARRGVSAQEAATYDLVAASQWNHLRLEAEPRSVHVRATAVVLGAGFIVAGGYALYAAIHGWFKPLMVPLVLLAAIALGYVPGAARRKASAQRVLPLRFPHRGLRLRFAELGVLLLALGAAIVAPAVSIYFAADIESAWFAYRTLVDEEANAARVVLVGSGLQWLLVMSFAGVPALLYFAFDREQLQTLRSKFVVHVFRFDPSVETLVDIDAKYGRLMNEAYGRKAVTGRILPGKRLPVVIATGAIALGWLLTLPLSGLSGAVDEVFLVHDYLRPQEEPIVFAFLGAYFFALNLVFRGYVRGDLRPKTYSQITVRILLSFVLAFVLGQAFATDAFILLVAFIGGLLPETLLVRFREAVRWSGGRLTSSGEQDPFEALVEQQPLTELEGVDIYDRARLEEEGVTNVEALAHHDLVELMLRTRIPVPRLIDWVDQAILYLHLGGRTPDARRAREALRLHGIRTASDLVLAWRKNHREFSARDGDVGPFADLVDTTHGWPSRLALIVDSIEDEEWIDTLLNWHERRAAKVETIEFRPGRGWIDRQLPPAMVAN